MEALEELDDIRAYDAAKSGSQEAIPFFQFMAEKSLKMAVRLDANPPLLLPGPSAFRFRL